MSFGISAVKETMTTTESEFTTSETELQSPLLAGLGATRKPLGSVHKLENSEKNFHESNRRMEMIVLRNTQGIHAPLRLAMELKSSAKVGRLPFLPSSNIMRDVLLGNDDFIGFEDTLNTVEFKEKMGNPHAVVEKNLGIL